ncbi:MAG TPA: hypothetical protein VGP79_01410 [Bryobacteraceae bacterium]|jgi:hypothetical protein|nr:hypothetical protein [Bryobacteraceae bacterium]
MSPTRSPSCGEKETLTERLTEARKSYAAAARSLQDHSGTDFKKAFDHAESAKSAYEVASQTLAAHIEEHRCDEEA